MINDDGNKGDDPPFQLFKSGKPIKDPTAHWTKEARKHLVGRRITEVRYLSVDESNALGWDGSRAIVLVLDNGALFFPSSDDEGNGPGALFGQGADGSEITLPVLSSRHG